MTMPNTRLSRTLLVVEGNFHLLAALQDAFRILLPPDWQTLPCRSAEEALHALETHLVDAVLADHDLPGASGLELLAIVAAKRPAIRRGLMLYRRTPSVRTAIAAVGDIHLLEKPFSVDELQAWLVSLPETERRQ